MEQDPLSENYLFCGYCGERLYSKLSIGYYCEICSKPICVDCRKRKNINFCSEHIDAQREVKIKKEIKCGICGKVITGSHKFIKRCQEPGCGEILCKVCAGVEETVYCFKHIPYDKKKADVDLHNKTNRVVRPDAIGMRKKQHPSISASQADLLSDDDTVELPKGFIIADRYNIRYELGRGGMGIVYFAYDNLLNISIAIKSLPKILSTSPKAIQRLKEEAKLSMTLSHPNILRIHNLEEFQGLYFIVMEYVEGKTLEDLIKEKGKLNIDETIWIAEEVAKGLDYAHSRKILHLDVKPANILINQQNNIIKMADFGIARQIKDSVTRLLGKEISGTLHYMSPEQVLRGKIDHRSDIYSFSVLLYESLMGSPPFIEEHIVELITKIKPRDLKGVPEHINNAIQKGLAKKPEDRFNKASELVLALRSELSGI